MTFEFTKNYKFTILNNENVWAKAMNRVVNEKVPVDKAVDEMIARIKAGRRLTYDARDAFGRPRLHRRAAPARCPPSRSRQHGRSRPRGRGADLAVADRGA